MKYNFDRLIDRTNTNSVKWDLTDQVFNKDKCLPLWVADSDWETAPEIKEAIKKRVKHGVYGYTYPSYELKEVIKKWVKSHYSWDIKTDWIVFANGVVPSINISIRALTVPGDGIIIQTPVYLPFISTVKNTGRQIVDNQLINRQSYFEIDFDDLKKQLNNENKDSCKRARLLLFCAPHNPVGRVWKKEELNKLNEIVLENDLVLVSDEIHSDFVYGDNQHIPAASLSKEIADKSITLMAPSKTFNIAGLSSSFAIIPNKKIREKFLSIKDHLVGRGNIFGLTAMKAAYSRGNEWLQAQLKYIEENIEFTTDYIDNNIPVVKYSKPQGTYLIWLDFRSIINCSETLNNQLVTEYNVALEPGNWFGESGAGFLRMNLATPRSNIKKALESIKKYVKKVECNYE
ncbi:MAG: pyridoxal phosphate-dependent aminotransferase [Halanaerobiales bacterium]|nr:pyridoxal phosphate-dependent aminotransferase [Halanaerobiales bacterium]